MNIYVSLVRVADLLAPTAFRQLEEAEEEKGPSIGVRAVDRRGAVINKSSLHQEPASGAAISRGLITAS